MGRSQRCGAFECRRIMMAIHHIQDFLAEAAAMVQNAIVTVCPRANLHPCGAG